MVTLSLASTVSSQRFAAANDEMNQTRQKWNFRRLPGRHPNCPPHQVIGILPKSFVCEDCPRPVYKPTACQPPRAPWRQCVETHVINDQVRRTLARWTHCRTVPPVLISNCEYERIMSTFCTEKRKDSSPSRNQPNPKCKAAMESVLARKRQDEDSKEQEIERQDEELKQRLYVESQKLCETSRELAERKLLMRKGLIKKFNAALSLSKRMEEGKQQSKKGQGDEEDGCSNSFADVISSFNVQRSPFYDCASKIRQTENKKCSPKVLELLSMNEQREAQRLEELHCAKESLRQLRASLMNPQDNFICSGTNVAQEKDAQQKLKQEAQKARREELLQDIEARRVSHIFMDQHEKEIERQACEFLQYKQKARLFEKRKERERVGNKNIARIANSEKTAHLMQETLKKKMIPWPSEYDRLKVIWEKEAAEKDNLRRQGRQAAIEIAFCDLITRRKVNEMPVMQRSAA